METIEERERERGASGRKISHRVSGRKLASWRAVVSRRLFTFRRGHRIDQLSLSLPLFLSNREIGEREIFLASSIYSPPRCSFYTTFCYRFRVGVEWEGGERGIREWAGRRKFVAFRQKSRTGQTGSPFSALFEPNFRQISPPLPRNWIVGFLHYGGESLPRFRERRL